jgi:3-hydroxyisobutyrate dehydrogenase
MERAGIVGVGAMGSALLELLRSKGVEVAAFDLAPSAVEKARSLGARVVASSKAVADASTIIDVVVRTDQDVLDCTTGKDGILEGAAPGTLLLLHSTILPETTKKVAEAASLKNVHVIDAAMTGVPRVVRAGDLTFLVGGPNELVDRARPHLLLMAKEVLHMGPLGAGNVAKLMRNLITGSETLIVHEALRMGQAAGIHYQDALEMMRKTQSTPLPARWQERFETSGSDPTPRVGQNIFDKDVPLAAEVGRRLGLELPITEQLSAAGQRLVAAAKNKNT